jgi:hypothetical protein
MSALAFSQSEDCGYKCLLPTQNLKSHTFISVKSFFGFVAADFMSALVFTQSKDCGYKCLLPTQNLKSQTFISAKSFALVCSRRLYVCAGFFAI